MSEAIIESAIFRCLRHEKSLLMFRIIYDELPFTISGMNLTRKQYYSSLNTLINVGLVNKLNGRYKVTSLGKIVHEFLNFLGTTLANDYWKFAFIDILTNTNPPPPVDEQIEIVSSLIESKDTKEILLKEMLSKEMLSKY